MVQRILELIFCVLVINNGLIIQYATWNNVDNGGTVTFPMSFNKIYNTFVTIYTDGNPSNQTYIGSHSLIRCAAPTVTNFKIYCVWATTNSVFTSSGKCIAIGSC